MEVQKLLEAQKYVTISLIPYMISKIRTGLSVFIDTCPLEPVRILAERMAVNFRQHWGSGDNGTVWTENEERGLRNRKKGSPKAVLLSAALDPRTKTLTGIPPADQLLIWEHLAMLMTAAYNDVPITRGR